MDILSELAKSITEGPKSRPQQVATSKSRVRTNGIVKSGPGGVIFDFGHQTDNAIINNYNAHLQHHADPEQAKIAAGQQFEFSKALASYVEKGDLAYSALDTRESAGVDPEWNKQLSGSTDRQVVEAFNKGILNVNEEQSAPAAGSHSLPTGNFSKSQIKMGNENIVATSETDAALIEMMKGGHFDEEKPD